MAREFDDAATALSAMNGIIRQQMRLVDVVLEGIDANKFRFGDEQATEPYGENERRILAMMILGMGTSAGTLVGFPPVAGLHVRDCFMIARSIFEASLNVCFILAEGPELARRADRHAQQKAFRDLNRASRIGDLAIEVGFRGRRPEPADVPELQRALDEFTTKSGGEVRQWTDQSVEQRIARVRAKFGFRPGLMLHTSLVSIYRHSSEILHGTYFGCLFFWGATQPNFRRDEDAMKRSIESNLFQVYMSVIFALDAALQCLAARLPSPELGQVAEEVFSKMHQLPGVKNALANE